MCGEARSWIGSYTATPGLSPRVRGSPGAARPGRDHPRIIPACAGKPRRAPTSGTSQWDYPRVCGEAFSRPRLSMSGNGLSPRVRGSPCLCIVKTRKAGIIPACAGKPSSPTWACRARRDYPRVCGEARSLAAVRLLLEGLSPRVRGSRCRLATGSSTPRIIPACAGKPAAKVSARPCGKDYPRVCGEAAEATFAKVGAQGLSPRVRGSHTA